MKNKYKYIAVYMGLMASGLAITRFEKNIIYGNPNFVIEMIPCLILMIVCVNYFYSREKRNSVIPWSQKSSYKTYLFVAIPVFCLTAISLYTNLVERTFHWELLIGALLVGIAEESMYRGLILKGLLLEKTVVKAIVIGAFWFSILHFLNIIGGQPIGAVAIQMVLTFISGLFFGIIYVKTKKLFPLIVLHGLWDYTAFSSNSENLQWLPKCGLILTLLEIIIVVIYFRNNRKYLKI